MTSSANGAQPVIKPEDVGRRGLGVTGAVVASARAMITAAAANQLVLLVCIEKPWDERLRKRQCNGWSTRVQ